MAIHNTLLMMEVHGLVVSTVWKYRFELGPYCLYLFNINTKMTLYEHKRAKLVNI